MKWECHCQVDNGAQDVDRDMVKNVGLDENFGDFSQAIKMAGKFSSVDALTRSIYFGPLLRRSLRHARVSIALTCSSA